MSIFGRKEIAQLKKELEINDLQIKVLQSDNMRLNEEHRRCLSALNHYDKEIRKYKSELMKASTEARDYKRKYAELLANTPEFMVPGQISAAENAVEEINSKNTKEVEDVNDKVYHIRNIVKKHSYYMDKVYRSKSDFFHSFKKDKTSNEYKMYKLLLNAIYEIKSESLINTDGECIRLSLFSQVRLADIVELQCSTFDKFKNGSFRNNVCRMIEENKPDFDNDDYKKAFVHPLLNLHIDFLICINEKTQCMPIMAIELHGSDHDENSEFADKKRIRNDEFKKTLFESDKVEVELLIVKNEDLDNKEFKDNIFRAIIKRLENRKGVIRI